MGLDISIDKQIVEVRTLDYCIENHYNHHKIDFVSIDTEGTELDVIKGFSLDKWKPKLLIIENNFQEPDIEIYLSLFGYKKDNEIGVNEYYLKT